MKTISVRDLQKKIRECMAAAQTDRIVVTRHGKPTAILIGVEGLDWEHVVLEADASFWKMIDKRRNSKTVSLAEVRKRTGVRKSKPASRAR